jgi:hypothetical protein
MIINNYNVQIEIQICFLFLTKNKYSEYVWFLNLVKNREQTGTEYVWFLNLVKIREPNETEISLVSEFGKNRNQK